MSEKQNCESCKYFVRYMDGSTNCLMKHDYCITNGVNVYPKECVDYVGDSV